MKRFALLAILASAPVSAASLPDPAYLDQLAARIEIAPAPSSTLDKAILAALRQPILTFDGRTLSTSAGVYTKYLATAETLAPKGWLHHMRMLPSNQIVAGLSQPTPANLPSYATAPRGVFATAPTPSGQGVAMSAAVIRAWAQIIRDGRSLPPPMLYRAAAPYKPMTPEEWRRHRIEMDRIFEITNSSPAPQR